MAHPCWQEHSHHEIMMMHGLDLEHECDDYEDCCPKFFYTSEEEESFIPEEQACTCKNGCMSCLGLSY